MWLFRVLVFRVLRLLLRAVPFCPLFRALAVRSVLAVLRVLIVLSALLFRLLRCSVFLRFWLAVVFPVLRLLCARLLSFLGVLLVAVCLWRFRLVRVRQVLPFLLRFGVVVRVRGVRWLWLLVWAFLCLWCRLWALVRLGLVLWLLVSVLLVLLLAVVRCGLLRLRPFSLLCCSGLVRLVVGLVSYFFNCKTDFLRPFFTACRELFLFFAPLSAKRKKNLIARIAGNMRPFFSLPCSVFFLFLSCCFGLFTACNQLL